MISFINSDINYYLNAPSATKTNQKKVATAPASPLQLQKSIYNIPANQLQGALGFVSPASATSNPAFRAKPLFNINLKKNLGNSNFEFLKADFSQLEPDSIFDQKNIEVLFQKWGWSDSNNWTQIIKENFLYGPMGKNFFCTALKGNGALNDRITALVETTPLAYKNFANDFEIHFLQANPKYANKLDKSEIKGSGELALYGCVKLAKENKFQRVILQSTNNSFYDKIGFSKYKDPRYTNDVDFYELKAENFNHFLSRIEKKYGINN